MVLNFIFPHKGTAIYLLFPFTIQKKGKTAGAIFPFRSSFSSHQKFVSIIFFLVLSVNAMYGFIVS